MRRKVDAGHDPDAGNILLRDYLPVWLDERTDPASGRPLRYTTAVSYRRIIERVLIPALGHVRLATLTTRHVETMLADQRRRTRPVSEATLKRIVATLGSALATARKRGLISHDPIAGIEWRPVDRKTAEPWTPAGWREFRTFAEGSRAWPWLLVCVDAGLRRGEVAGLRWESVNLDERTLVVENTRTQVGRTIVDGAPKSGKRRIAHITPETVLVLRGWRTRQAGERLAFGPEYAVSGYVFTDEAGQPVKPDTIGQTFRRMVAESGVRGSGSTIYGTCRRRWVRWLVSRSRRLRTGSATRQRRSRRRCTCTTSTSRGAPPRRSGL
jgi:integrase